MGIRPIRSIASACRDAVDREMLQRRHDMFTLQSPGHCHAQLSIQIGVLSISGKHSTPPWVPGRIGLGCIYVGVTQGSGFLSLHAADLVNQFGIPCAALPYFDRETGRLVRLQPANAFIGEVHRDPQACLLDEEPLDIVHGLGMSRWGPVQFRQLPRIELLVNVGDAVDPRLVQPCLGRLRILQDGAITVQSDQLCRLFLQVHATEQVSHTLVYRQCRVFIRIHFPVLVQIDPPVMVNRGIALEGIRLCLARP